MFNEGYTASSGATLTRDDLRTDAIRLGRVLSDVMPDEPEVWGLLALMLLIESRRAARTTPDGALVVLADQDRSLWNHDLVAEGHALVRRCLPRGAPGPYQIHAAINAVHGDAATAADTDWAQIRALYDHLLSVQPTAIVALHRAVAVAEVDGPAAGLAIVDDLPLSDHHVFHVVRADLLRRMDRRRESVDAYDAAIDRTDNAAEREFLQRRRDALRPGSLSGSPSGSPAK